MIQFSLNHDKNRAIVLATCGGMFLGQVMHPGYSVGEVVALFSAGIVSVYFSILFME